jgi:hypothetical protein
VYHSSRRKKSQNSDLCPEDASGIIHRKLGFTAVKCLYEFKYIIIIIIIIIITIMCSVIFVLCVSEVR